jgi:hypothetical protein
VVIHGLWLDDDEEEAKILSMPAFFFTTQYRFSFPVSINRIHPHAMQSFLSLPPLKTQHIRGFGYPPLSDLQECWNLIIKLIQLGSTYSYSLIDNWIALLPVSKFPEKDFRSSNALVKSLINISEVTIIRLSTSDWRRCGKLLGSLAGFYIMLTCSVGKSSGTLPKNVDGGHSHLQQLLWRPEGTRWRKIIRPEYAANHPIPYLKNLSAMALLQWR